MTTDQKLAEARAAFEDPIFTAWWEEAYAYIQQNPADEEFLDCPDYGWGLEQMQTCYRIGLTPIEAVRHIVDDYDPTPSYAYDFFH